MLVCGRWMSEPTPLSLPLIATGTSGYHASDGADVQKEEEEELEGLWGGSTGL